MKKVLWYYFYKVTMYVSSIVMRARCLQSVDFLSIDPLDVPLARELRCLGVSRELLKLCLVDLLQLWAAERSNEVSDSVLKLSEDRCEKEISLDLSSGLEREAAKVVALEEVGRVEDASGEVLEIDTSKVVALAVEVATDVQEFWVQSGEVDNVAEEVWDGVGCGQGAAVPVLGNALVTMRNMC